MSNTQGAEGCFRRFLQGDPGGFEDIIGLYKDNLICFLNRYVHNIDTAEDLAAEAFAELYVHRARYRFGGNFKTYLFAIGKHKAAHYLRKHARVVPVGAQVEPDWPDTNGPETALLRNERDRALHAAMERLTTDYREVLHLLYFEQLSYADAAKVLGKSKKQIDNLAYRAKGALKLLLQEEGFPDEI